MSLVQQIASTTQLDPKGVGAAVALFDEGATLPFVARYRKERTGGLDEVQLRLILEQRRLILELNSRRSTILEALKAQGKLTAGLRSALEGATRKSELEDLYAPFKKGRKTRGDQAREAGLKPLADLMLRQPRQTRPEAEARRFVRGSIRTVEDALKGARDIVAEQLASDPKRRALVRRTVREHGRLVSRLKKGKTAGTFRDYAEYSERAKTVPSHRYLALCRGEAEGILGVKVDVDQPRLLSQVLRNVGLQSSSPWSGQLRLAAEDALKRLLLPTAIRAVRKVLKTAADEEAILVFQRNLEALLLAAPLGTRSVIGIDPGIRTGCKAAVVSETGDYLAHRTFQLVGRSSAQTGELLAFLKRHQPFAVAVGNGTGGRETETIVRKLVADHGLRALVVSVSEAGASVYSASELAGAELPNLDLTVRGAVSIARRLQDPLAELVKVDPRSIGVGQYQHDVDGGRLKARLEEVVESCVNRVGVDLNTASPALLGQVAGLGPKLAETIVHHRQQRGPYRRRKDLLAVSGLGPKTYEQCAGFLRIRGGSEPLDNSAVHPERYPLVQRMVRDLGMTTSTAMGSERLAELELQRYVDANTGMATLTDVLEELRRPGRDPREAFEATEFREDVQGIDDLVVGMRLSGVVTNVTNFGAFVDIGVHQDGLVHISQLANTFIRDPHQVVHPGSRVKVVVLEVDKGRKRIALSMKQA